MRKGSWACICLLLVAVMLLSACDRAEDDPSGTPVPKLTSSPTLPPSAPEDVPAADDSSDDEGTWPDSEAAIWPDGEAGDWLDEEQDTAPDDEESDPEGETEADQLAAMGAALGPGLPTASSPTPEPTQMARMTPDPAQSPIPVDPIDKPTQVPLELAFVNYSSVPMGIAFDRPAGWKEDAPADSNVQFTEPQIAARNGYRTMLTIRVFHKGSSQNRESASAQLDDLMEELAQNTLWVDFKAYPSGSASLSGASGVYAYYTATFNGTPLRGRMIVVARGSSLYMVRITSTQEFFSLYEDIYRKVRETWTFI